jgi:hypothetical protein
MAVAVLASLPHLNIIQKRLRAKLISLASNKL